MPPKRIVGPSPHPHPFPLPLLLLPGPTSSKQFPSSCILLRGATSPQAQEPKGQLTMDWILQNYEPKLTFPPFKLIISGIFFLNNNGNLTNILVNQLSVTQLGWKEREDHFTPLVLVHLPSKGFSSLLGLGCLLLYAQWPETPSLPFYFSARPSRCSEFKGHLERVINGWEVFHLQGLLLEFERSLFLCGFSLSGFQPNGLIKCWKRKETKNKRLAFVSNTQYDQ